MFNIFKKKSDEAVKEVENKEVDENKTGKKRKDLSDLKEKKLQYREEKKKKQEENKRKRIEEEKILKAKEEEAEQKRKEEFKKAQEQKQEAYKKRQEEKANKVTQKQEKVDYQEENDFELFGYKMIDLKQGMIIEGTIISETNEDYIVEVKDNYQEVLFPKVEKLGDISIGQEIKALIYRHSNDDFYISQRRLENAEVINKIKELQKNKEIVKGKVLDFANSNYVVELENGHKGLVYQVNIDINFVQDPKTQIGQEYEFLIRRVYPRGEYKFELTRIPLLKKALEEKAELVKEDVIIPVKEFTKNRAGIEFDYEGFRVFIPYKLLSYNFINSNDDLSGFINKNAKIIECKQTRFGYNVVASIKALEEDPFDVYIKENSVGDVVSGKIIRKEAYGMFVELAEGIRGLHHRNDFSTELTNEFDDLKTGDVVSCKIKELNTEKKQINLES